MQVDMSAISDASLMSGTCLHPVVCMQSICILQAQKAIRHGGCWRKFLLIEQNSEHLVHKLGIC